jgi:hypothetical protein
MTVQATDSPPRPDRRRLPSRKVVPLPIGGLAGPDSIEAWAARYLDAAIRGVRSPEVTDKIALHLARFGDHFHDVHGHERLSAVIRREVLSWREHLATDPNTGGLGLAPATVNAHLASLSGFMTWVLAHEPAALPGAERIRPGSGGSARLRSSRPCWVAHMADAPVMLQVGQHAIDQQEHALAPDPGPKPSVPRLDTEEDIRDLPCYLNPHIYLLVTTGIRSC